MEPKEKTSDKPKNGWLQKLGKLVYETDPSEIQEETSIPVQTVNSGVPNKFSYSDIQQNTNASPNTPSMAFQNQNGMFDEKFYNSFLQILEVNNIEGMDYFEFSKVLKSLSSTGMADPLRYQAAFSSLQANSDLTKQRLLETADFYIEKLDQEEKSFGVEMQSEVNNQVNSRLSQAKSKQDEISKKQEEINKLQSEMGALQSEIGSLNMEAQQTQAKIESTAKNFKVSLEVLKGQINLDKQNINTYIQK